jgi:prevent-host-death family protein
MSFNTETIAIHKAKTTLSQLVKRAKDGEPVYIGGYGKPEVVLTAVGNHKGAARAQAFGCLKNHIRMADDFDTLPKAVQESFYSGL